MQRHMAEAAGGRGLRGLRGLGRSGRTSAPFSECMGTACCTDWFCVSRSGWQVLLWESSRCSPVVDIVRCPIAMAGGNSELTSGEGDGSAESCEARRKIPSVVDLKASRSYTPSLQGTACTRQRLRLLTNMTASTPLHLLRQKKNRLLKKAGSLSMLSSCFGGSRSRPVIHRGSSNLPNMA